MSINKQIQKRMVDKDVNGAIALSKISGVSYQKTLRLINGDMSLKLKDVVDVLKALDLEITVTVK